uniref:TBC1 domain family member 7 n=2 Tax=Lepeophtheirus salmonis TaxID=72036 RepID=A0A0K2TDW8_LEPSM
MSRNDERNFRTHYYERVGFKGLNEKTLDTLLNEEPRSIEKLQQFCLRFSVPSIMRLEVWKVIYEFSSIYSKNSSEMLWWKENPYFHIKQMEKRMQKITDDMSLPQELTVQFLVRQGWIKFDVKSQLKELSSCNFTTIATSMVKITDSAEVASFYLSQELHKFLHSHPKRIMDDLEKSFIKKLSNIHPKLYSYCEKIDLLNNLPIRVWISRAFAGVIHENVLVKVWDKVIGGSMKILVFVAISIMELCNSRLQQSADWREGLKIFDKLSEEDCSIIVQKAIDQWTKDGCQLFPCDHNRMNREDCTSIVPFNKTISKSTVPLQQLVKEIKFEN